MLGLYKFLAEHLILENTEAKAYLINNYEEAVKYLDELGLFDDKDPSGITKQDIKELFNYMTTNMKKAPIVANYGGKKGFAFRRWVADDNVADIFTKINSVKQRGYICKGFHNTSMKENGAWEPGSTEMEIVIAYVFNKYYNFKTDDKDNIEYSSGNSWNNDVNQKILNWCKIQINYDKIVNIVKTMSVIKTPIRKKETSDPTTKEWEELGNYKANGKKPNKTPKTDLISEDNKYKISLKNSKGAQLMSGKYNESMATLISAIDGISDENDRKKLLSLFDVVWYDINTKLVDLTPEDIRVKKLSEKELHKNATNILSYLINKYQDFKYKIMFEAATGNIKFGNNSPAAANYVLSWDAQNQSTLFIPIKTYINKMSKKPTKIYVDFKGSKTSTWTVLRMEVK